MNFDLSTTANLLGDPGRAAILLSLLGGIALPAGELAHIAKRRVPHLDVIVTSGRPLKEALPDGARFWPKPSVFRSAKATNVSSLSPRGAATAACKSICRSRRACGARSVRMACRNR